MLSLSKVKLIRQGLKLDHTFFNKKNYENKKSLKKRPFMWQDPYSFL